jgi:hypothetical protein
MLANHTLRAWIRRFVQSDRFQQHEGFDRTPASYRQPWGTPNTLVNKVNLHIEEIALFVLMDFRRKKTKRVS